MTIDFVLCDVMWRVVVWGDWHVFRIVWRVLLCHVTWLGERKNYRVSWWIFCIMWLEVEKETYFPYCVTWSFSLKEKEIRKFVWYDLKISSDYVIASHRSHVRPLAHRAHTGRKILCDELARSAYIHTSQPTIHYIYINRLVVQSCWGSSFQIRKRFLIFEYQAPFQSSRALSPPTQNGRWSKF